METENVKKVDKCCSSVTPFSINDILSNKMESAEDDSDLQESALDMSKSQNGIDGKFKIHTTNLYFTIYLIIYHISIFYVILCQQYLNLNT